MREREREKNANFTPQRYLLQYLHTCAESLGKRERCGWRDEWKIRGMTAMGTHTHTHPPKNPGNARIGGLRGMLFFFRLLNMNPWRKYSFLVAKSWLPPSRRPATVVGPWESNTVFHIDYVMHNVLEGIMGLQWLPICTLWVNRAVLFFCFGTVRDSFNRWKSKDGATPRATVDTQLFYLMLSNEMAPLFSIICNNFSVKVILRTRKNRYMILYSILSVDLFVY